MPPMENAARSENAPEPWRPNAEIEDMLVRMFAPRPAVTSQPDDPARLAAMWEEWRVFYLLTWWRTDPEAESIKEQRHREFMKKLARRNARYERRRAAPLTLLPPALPIKYG